MFCLVHKGRGDLHIVRLGRACGQTCTCTDVCRLVPVHTCYVCTNVDDMYVQMYIRHVLLLHLHLFCCTHLY